MKLVNPTLYLSVFFMLCSCGLKGQENKTDLEKIVIENTDNQEVIIEKPITKVLSSIKEIPLPEGFERIKVGQNSFGQYLRNLPLKTDDNIINYYDGSENSYQDGHLAIVDMEIGTRDLQQCADVAMRLRAEYLYQNKKYDQIQFTFASGGLGKFTEYAKGYRGKIQGNKLLWRQTNVKAPSYSRKTFNNYMNLIYAYAGTISLPNDVKSVALDDMQIGDIFLKTGRPFGHAVTVADMAENKATGEKIFLVVQGFLPAQQFHVLKNLNSSETSAWYTLKEGESLELPQWTFETKHLKRYKK
jgi:hypothetical protein